MAIPKFLLEISKYKKKSSTKIWSKFKDSFIYLSYKRNNLDISFHNFFGNKLCILGTPIINNKIDNDIFAKLYIKNKKNNNWLKEIDGEFVIIFLSKEEKIEIISSRFNFPTIWYFKSNNTFLISINFTEIVFKLKELGTFKLNEDALFDFLLFRRVFGEKSTAQGVKISTPATKLIYNGSDLKKERYWNPNFSLKKNNNIDSLSDELIYHLSNSLKKKMSDNNRFGLFLSGGMDTRLILACAKKNNLNLCSFTFNTFENRETKVAREVAKITKTPNYFVVNKENHYKKVLPEAVYSTGSMYQPLCLFYNHSNFVKKYADVGLHGHGFDFFFQGMYLPRKKINFFNKKLDLLLPIKIKGNNIDFFLKNISYKTKGENISRFFKKEKYALMYSRLKYELKEVEDEAKKFCNTKIDLYEFLTFSNLPRHYSFCDNISMNSILKIRTPSFDNNLYDFFQKLPWQSRFDSKIQRLSLQKLNPKLANLISANTNLPINYSSYQKTFFQFLNFFKRKILNKKIKEDLFERMGLPIGYLIKNDWRTYIEDIINSERLYKIKFLEFDLIKRYLKDFINNKELKYDQFVMLLISIDNFLRLMDEKKKIN